MRPFWSLIFLMDSNEFLCVLIVPYVSLWVLMDPNVSVSVLMNPNAFLSVLM